MSTVKLHRSNALCIMFWKCIPRDRWLYTRIWLLFPCSWVNHGRHLRRMFNSQARPLPRWQLSGTLPGTWRRFDHLTYGAFLVYLGLSWCILVCFPAKQLLDRTHWFLSRHRRRDSRLFTVKIILRVTKGLCNPLWKKLQMFMQMHESQCRNPRKDASGRDKYNVWRFHPENLCP